MKLAILDCETTGLDPRKHEIIEIAALICDKNTLAVEQMFHSKIRPNHIETADPVALRINGYTPEAWSAAPHIFSVLASLDPFINGAALVAYNVTFDNGFLEAAYRQVGRPYPFQYQKYCALSLAAFLIPGKSSYSLKNVCGYLGIPPEPEIHSAKNGAVCAHAVLKALLKKV